MNFQSIVNLALSLVSKKDEIMGIASDVLALWKKIQSTVPGLVKQLEGVAGKVTDEPIYDIKWLQESLNKLMGSNLAVDGKYGTNTQNAVKLFQQNHGLTADGWAGVQTQAAIVDALKSAG